MRDISLHRVKAIKFLSRHHTSSSKRNNYSSLFGNSHIISLLCLSFDDAWLDRHKRCSYALLTKCLYNFCNKTILWLHYEHNKHSCNYTQRLERLNFFASAFFFDQFEYNWYFMLFVILFVFIYYYTFYFLVLCAVLSGMDGIRVRCCCALGFYIVESRLLYCSYTFFFSFTHC